jgi:predicted amidohydrolase
LRVSVIQMNSGHDKSANIAQARGLIEKAIAADRPRILALPEIWTCLGGDYQTKLNQGEPLPPAGSKEKGGDAYEFLRGIAREHQMYVHGGSIGEQAEGKLFNTTVVFDPTGWEIARYRKIHLFDVVTPDGTGYRETLEYGTGSSLVTYEADGVKIGCAICYDLRFPEMFLALRRAGAELIFLPAAFTLQTGKDHWEVLLQARAIETQCWFAAPGTWGRNLDANGDPRFTYGHSLICDPWGQITAKVSDGIGWATAHIDRSITERVRRDMPVLDHRSPSEKAAGCAAKSSAAY